MKRENDYDLIFWLTVFILVGVMVFMAFFDNLAKASTTPIVTISGGQSVLNSLQDQHGTAFQLDQRQVLGFNMRGERWGYDAGYINLGHQAGLKTDGLFGLYQVRFFKGSVASCSFLKAHLMIHFFLKLRNLGLMMFHCCRLFRQNHALPCCGAHVGAA